MQNPWLLAFRPKTLTAAIVPVVVGTAVVAAQSLQVDWLVFWLALGSALCIQIGTNLFNDAIDFKKGADDEKRIGPRRVTQSGLISERMVLFGAVLFFLVATLLGLPLVIKGGVVILVIGLFSLLCGYVYTGGPYPLAYVGLGDLFVVIFFGLIAVGGIYYLHTGHWGADATVAGLQVGFLATVLIAVNNLRDVEQDRLANKKTLAVRFGKNFVRWEITLLLTLTFALMFYWLHRESLLVLLPLLILPLAFVLVRNVFRHEPGPIYNRLLAIAAMIHILFGFCLTVGLAVAK